MTDETIRDRATRIADAQAKIEADVDVWVSSAGEDGNGYLVPLSYYWDGVRMTMAAHSRSPTVVNLARSGWARVALGPTRDVVIIEGAVEVFSTDGQDELAAAHAAGAGFDTRLEEAPYSFIQLTPDTIQAWRNAPELRGRTVMRDGTWLV
ncbi:MAG: hypothetical protein R2849_17425 [Thermomicrobiales bacterium]